MRSLFFVPILMFLIFIPAGFGTVSADGAGTAGWLRAGLPFVENRGEYPDEAAFWTRTREGALFVTRDGALFHVLPAPVTPGKAGGAALREIFIGDAEADPRGVDPSDVRVRSFRGASDAAARAMGRAFDSLSLGRVYRGVDVRLVLREGRVEKLFHVLPGADPKAIRVRVDGADRLEVGRDGRLIVHTARGEVSFSAPRAFQGSGADRRTVEAAYRVEGDCYGFRLGDYDPEVELIIDPLVASTYLGGGGEDRGMTLIPDGQGGLYGAGYTFSADFPTTPGAFEETYCGGSFDACVVKFSSDLSTLQAATFLGGSGNEGPYYLGLARDGQGDLYVAGNTTSQDFPVTPGAFDTTYNGNVAGPYGDGGDVFVARLDAGLSTLKACTFLGGSSHDYAARIAVDGTDGLFIVGSSGSLDLPVTSGAYDPTPSAGGNFNENVILARLTRDLTAVTALTYLGGTGDDFVEGLGMDSQGRPVITGWTRSQNFPVTPGAFDTTYNGHYYDAFVSRLDAGLTALEASTYVGGESWEFGYALALDDQDRVYITGHTASKNTFPVTPGAYDETYNSNQGANYGDDVFLTRLDPDLTAVEASTYLGGAKWENATDLTVDDVKDEIYVTGNTSSTDFPVSPAAFERTYQGGTKHAGDLFVSRFDLDLTTLEASTLLGGTGEDGGLYVRLALDPEGGVYVSAETASVDFPVTPGAPGTAPLGSGDMTLTRLDRHLSSDHVLYEATGGTLLFALEAGAANAGRNYILLGSMTGTTPGTPLPGGQAVLPLNWDAFTNLVVTLANTTLFKDFAGTLDAYGDAEAILDLGPLPGGAGMTLHFAFALNKPWDYVSDPIPVGVEK